MSTKEIAYSIIDGMNEEQLSAFIVLFKDFAKIPNKETLEAMREVEDMKLHHEKYKGYNDVDETMRDLLS